MWPKLNVHLDYNLLITIRWLSNWFDCETEIHWANKNVIVLSEQWTKIFRTTFRKVETVEWDVSGFQMEMKSKTQKLQKFRFHVTIVCFILSHNPLPPIYCKHIIYVNIRYINVVFLLKYLLTMIDCR